LEYSRILLNISTPRCRKCCCSENLNRRWFLQSNEGEGEGNNKIYNNKYSYTK